MSRIRSNRRSPAATADAQGHDDRAFPAGPRSSAPAPASLTAIASRGCSGPSDALADWNKGAFEAKTVADALKNLKVAAPAETKDIVISAPDIAENGAVVPIEIQSNMPGTSSIAVLIEKNPFPYAGELRLRAGARCRSSRSA